MFLVDVSIRDKYWVVQCLKCLDTCMFGEPMELEEIEKAIYKWQDEHECSK